jgi:hypothetical protein
VDPVRASCGDVLAEGPHALLRETPDGYELHRHDRDVFERFPLTDEGSDDAWNRYLEVTRQGRVGRWLAALVPVAIVSGAAWFAIVLIAGVASVRLGFDRVGTDDSSTRLLTYVVQFGEAMSTLFIAAAGSYVILWLYRKGIPTATRR